MLQIILSLHNNPWSLILESLKLSDPQKETAWTFLLRWLTSQMCNFLFSFSPGVMTITKTIDIVVEAETNLKMQSQISRGKCLTRVGKGWKSLATISKVSINGFPWVPPINHGNLNWGWLHTTLWVIERIEVRAKIRMKKSQTAEEINEWSGRLGIL